MEQFNPKTEMASLKIWFKELKASGDFVTTVHSSLHSWRAFRRHFIQTPLFVTYDGIQIVSAFWVHPWLDGVEVAYWMRKSFRLDRAVWRENIAFLTGLVKRFPVVVACTVQEKVVHLLKHFGFKSVGLVPNAWDGLPAWVLQVTEVDFNDCGFKVIRAENSEGVK